MKRKGDIYKKLCSRKNIKIAFQNAQKGKGHYREVMEVNDNLEFYVSDLKYLLENKLFKTSKYIVYERKSGNKMRTIARLPYYPDRIVHHCIVQQLFKIWMNTLIRDTYAAIPGRGIHDGFKRVKQSLQDIEGTKYCLKTDIRKYFNSMDHDVMKLVNRKIIKDKDFLELLDGIIDSYEDGNPIGNYVSQWFANIYLSWFDHYCKEVLKCKYYFRYNDDVVILDSSKKRLHGILVAMNNYYYSKLNVQMKSNYQIFPVDKRGIDFLGYRFFHKYILVRKGIVKNMKKNVGKPKSMASYWGWLKYADAYRLTNKYFKYEWIIKHKA